MVALAEDLQAASGKRVLWGTAQLFKHPRYAHGAATSAHPAWPSLTPCPGVLLGCASDTQLLEPAQRAEETPGMF